MPEAGSGQQKRSQQEEASLKSYPTCMEAGGLLHVVRLRHKGVWLLHTSTLHGEAAQAPTLSCKCGRRGRGLQGECCSCSTMRPVSGMKSAAIRNSAAREESQTFAHKAVPWGRAGGGSIDALAPGTAGRDGGEGSATEVKASLR